MYTKVVNPKTGRKVAITSRLGKQIIKNYLNYLRGGESTGGEELSAAQRYKAQMTSIATMKGEVTKLETKVAELTAELDEKTVEAASAAKKVQEATEAKLICQRNVSSCNGNLATAQASLKEALADFELCDGAADVIDDVAQEVLADQIATSEEELAIVADGFGDNDQARATLFG
tara:strand:- start:520 stop:1044 length:525 start_codon:yes stop_codon:yes gene_type:complete